MDDEPLHKPVSSATIDGRWLLTHALWKDHPETGVRDLHDVDEKTRRPRFDLIQHGWHRFDDAERIIAMGLRKGWSPFRISEAIDRMKSMRRAPRATVV